MPVSRKHVITGQGYIAQLVRCLEADGVLPLPIFINGIEAHTVVCLRACCLLFEHPGLCRLMKYSLYI